MQNVGECSSCVAGGSSNTHLQVENCLAVGCYRCLSLFATLLGVANVSITNVRLAFSISTNQLENMNHYDLGKPLKIMY